MRVYMNKKKKKFDIKQVSFKTRSQKSTSDLRVRSDPSSCDIKTADLCVFQRASIFFSWKLDCPSLWLRSQLSKKQTADCRVLFLPAPSLLLAALLRNRFLFCLCPLAQIISPLVTALNSFPWFSVSWLKFLEGGNCTSCIVFLFCGESKGQHKFKNRLCTPWLENGIQVKVAVPQCALQPEFKEDKRQALLNVRCTVISCDVFH